MENESLFKQIISNVTVKKQFISGSERYLTLHNQIISS